MMNEDNAVIVIDKSAQTFLAENQEKIKNRDGSKVFPITVALRKKLEQLKAESLGDIKTQFKFVKESKYAEYVELNKKRVLAVKKEIEVESNRLQKKAYKIMRTKRNEDRRQRLRMIGQAQSFYASTDALHKKYPEIIKEFQGYDFPLKAYQAKDKQREQEEWERLKQEKDDLESFKLSLNEELFEQIVLRKEFKEKYANGFNEAESKIKQLEIQFDEALLFGDLEVVKNVYYNLKKAEQFLDALRGLKLK